MSKIFFKTPEAGLIGMLHDSEGTFCKLFLAVLDFYFFNVGLHNSPHFDFEKSKKKGQQTTQLYITF